MPVFEITTESTTTLTYEVTANNESAARRLLCMGDATFIKAIDDTERLIAIRCLRVDPQ